MTIVNDALVKIRVQVSAEMVSFHLACLIDTVMVTEKTALIEWVMRLTHNYGRRTGIDGRHYGFFKVHNNRPCCAISQIIIHGMRVHGVA